jgi:hypothetical protein
MQSYFLWQRMVNVVAMSICQSIYHSVAHIEAWIKAN